MTSFVVAREAPTRDRAKVARELGANEARALEAVVVTMAIQLSLDA
jgi:hypothetical protein